MNPAKRLGLALSYVTAFPFLRKPSSEDELRGLAIYLPTAGVIIGVVLFLCWQLLSRLNAPPSVASVLLTVVWIAVTGGIHMDGLMDTADGVFSHRSRERMLEIMRDSRTGNFGAITGVLLILCKYCALMAAPSAVLGALLILIPAWARWSEVLAIACYPYAREEGMGRVWHDTTSFPADVIIAAIVPIIATAALSSFWNCSAILLVSCAGAVLSGSLCSCFINYHLKGQTGDTYGAAVEVAEAGGMVISTLIGACLLPH